VRRNKKGKGKNREAEMRSLDGRPSAKRLAKKRDVRFDCRFWPETANYAVVMCKGDETLAGRKKKTPHLRDLLADIVVVTHGVGHTRQLGHTKPGKKS
jgi:hypothetical protein